MKQGVFIYQKPASLFTGVGLGKGTYGVVGFRKGIELRKKFIEQLNKKLAGFVMVTEDSTDANMEEIVEQNFDFIVCSPGLQKIVTASKHLPPIIYTDSYEFHITAVNPTINEINKILNN